MTHQPAEWNTELATWAKEHPEEEKKLRKRLGPKSMRDYETGIINNLDKVTPYRRAVLYKITGIESIRPEHYADPDSLRLSPILEGTHARGTLPIWLGKYDLNQTAVAEKAQVDRRTVVNFIEGRPTRGDGESKVVKVLREYGAQYEANSSASPLQAPLPAPSLGTRASSHCLDDLATQAHQLTEAVRSLGGKVELDASAWRTRGMYAIGLLTEVMEHYAGSKPEERRAFVDAVKEQELIPTFGWCSSVFSGLLKDDNSPDAFARSMRPQRGKRR